MPQVQSNYLLMTVYICNLPSLFKFKILSNVFILIFIIIVLIKHKQVSLIFYLQYIFTSQLFLLISFFQYFSKICFFRDITSLSYYRHFAIILEESIMFRLLLFLYASLCLVCSLPRMQNIEFIFALEFCKGFFIVSLPSARIYMQ